MELKRFFFFVMFGLFFFVIFGLARISLLDSRAKHGNDDLLDSRAKHGNDE